MRQWIYTRISKEIILYKDIYMVAFIQGPVYTGLDTRTSIDDCIQGPLVRGLGTLIFIQGALYKYFCIMTVIRQVQKGLYIKDFQYIQRPLYRYLKKKPNLIQGHPIGGSLI